MYPSMVSSLRQSVHNSTKIRIRLIQQVLHIAPRGRGRVTSAGNAWEEIRWHDPLGNVKCRRAAEAEHTSGASQGIRENRCARLRMPTQAIINGFGRILHRNHRFLSKRIV
jgi:hypothetical protein